MIQDVIGQPDGKKVPDTFSSPNIMKLLSLMLSLILLLALSSCKDVSNDRTENKQAMHRNVEVLTAVYVPDRNEYLIASISDGNVTVLGPVDKASSVVDGIVNIELDGIAYFLTNKHGDLKTIGPFAELTYFRDSYAAAVNNGVTSIVDARGELISGGYANVSWLTHITSETVDRVPKLIPVAKDEKWGFVRLNGEQIIDFKYDFAYPFSDGVSRVKADGKFSFINENGDVVLQSDINRVSDFNSGLALAFDSDSDKYGYINKSGSWAISPQWERAFDFSDGYAVVSNDIAKHAVVINIDGRKVFSWNGQLIPGFINGLILFQDVNGLQGLLDTNGDIVLAAKFDWIQRPLGEYFAAVIETRVHIFNVHGDEIVSFDCNDLKYDQIAMPETDL